MAAGERIVAFARPGKPPEIRFWQRAGCAYIAMQPFQIRAGSQRFLKACSATDEAPKAIQSKNQSKKEMAAITLKREARKSLQQPGWITFEGGFAARRCLVQDMSTTGAKLTIDDPNSLPARLRLALTRDARTGRNCEVVWRRGNSVGIKFVQ
jgi:hypothetical protein